MYARDLNTGITLIGCCGGPGIEFPISQGMNKPKRFIGQNPVVFSTPCSIDYSRICNIVNQHLPVLSADAAMCEVLKDELRCVAKKAPTLGNKLCPSMILTSDEAKPCWLKHIVHTTDAFVAILLTLRKLLHLLIHFQFTPLNST